jgi:hypothetical protein
MNGGKIRDIWIYTLFYIKDKKLKKHFNEVKLMNKIKFFLLFNLFNLIFFF